MPSNFSFDLIIPCYNPPKYWDLNFIHKFQQVESSVNKNSIQPILINDGTNNGRLGSIEIERLKKEIPNLKIIHLEKNQGKGNALREGVSQAKNPYQVFTDIDFPYTFESLQNILSELKLGADIALGFRRKDYYTSVPFSRRIISKFLRWLLKRILRLPITDTQCGLKGFNEKGKVLFLKTKINRFLFDLEFIQLASRNKGLKIQPTEVKLRDNIEFSSMNYRVLIGEFFNFVLLIFR